MLRKLVFGTAWFFLLYFGACIAAGVVLGAVAGATDPKHAREAGRIAAEKFMGEHAPHMMAGALLLSVAGAAMGFLPGTRRRPAVAVLAAQGPVAVLVPAEGPVAELPPSDVPAPVPVAPLRPFGLREGFVALIGMIAAQFAVFFAIGLFAAFDVGTHATAAVRNARVAELIPIGLPLAYSAAALVLFQLFSDYARRPDWPAIRDSFGLAWGTPSANLAGLFAGVVLAVLFLVVAPQLADPRLAGPNNSGTLSAGPAGILAFATSVVLLAPPTEELLFRSLLIRSLVSRLSLPVAAFVSAALFWVIHVPEAQSYWPAEIAIALLAALATWLRLSERAVGPAISSHAGYNFVIAGSVLLARAAG